MIVKKGCLKNVLPLFCFLFYLFSFLGKVAANLNVFFAVGKNFNFCFI